MFRGRFRTNTLATTRCFCGLVCRRRVGIVLQPIAYETHVKMIVAMTTNATALVPRLFCTCSSAACLPLAPSLSSFRCPLYSLCLLAGLLLLLLLLLLYACFITKVIIISMSDSLNVYHPLPFSYQYFFFGLRLFAVFKLFFLSLQWGQWPTQINSGL